ncbi:hypothetical protein COCMIDRAFT_24704 [Bipolaris oryzae ATCC 44560]|uniref:Uncharacterized protein n=1 Tax=Bipolaris oryzae ATCC 44560 TaxID=930090 RepID=W6Z6M4_COCMI|nr:uncharacterized protein COCMIDRAFT_24704 [Bipolaris oryzae ATCC 44560]EUC47382.1 hypothetical protein COCMIDRAFT_24704 [Bipolaris oryzae ATCC 44560]
MDMRTGLNPASRHCFLLRTVSVSKMAKHTPRVQISDGEAIGEFRDSYSVAIHNNFISSKNHTSSLKPPLSEPSDIPVNTHVILAAKGVPNDGDVVRWEIPNQLYAICGYNYLPVTPSLSEDGIVAVIAKATIEVVAKASVTLGSDSKDGTTNAASSLTVNYLDETLSFASTELVSSLTTVGGFTITTGGGFTPHQAKRGV